MMPALRRIAILTSGRQDWGILRPVCDGLRAYDDLRVEVVVAGMHLSARHGHSVDLVRADGYEPAATIPWLDGAEDPPPERQAAMALDGVGEYLRTVDPDALVLAGDRFETAAAALAATLLRVPIAHLHGGEQTLGAFDDALRHAITKMSHLHLASSETHARRIIAMGEDPSSVHVVGAPATDASFGRLPDRSALERDLGGPLTSPLVLVTVHPATLDEDPAAVVRPVIAAMDLVPATYVITMPNADPGGDAIAEAMRSAAGPGRYLVSALGERRYWGLMRIADAMLGNSSSGLIEAPAMHLPVVNVGDRQAGRSRGPNVIDAEAEVDAIATALRRAISKEFRLSLPRDDDGLVDGRSGERAAHIIATWDPTRPPRKAPIPVAR